MTVTTVTTQDALDAALATEATCIHIDSPASVWLVLSSSGSSSVVAWGSSRVEAWDSSSVVARGSSRVVAWDSSRVVASDSSSVVAWDSSRVVARGSSSVVASGSSSVVARGSSSVVASGSSRVEAWDSSSVEATPFVAIHLHAATATVDGGVLIDVTQRDRDGQAWCDYHGVAVADGKAVLYKAVHDDWRTRRGPEWTYVPGSTVVAEDFDPARECGQGLHLCPSPRGSRRYLTTATRYVAVEVGVASIVPLDDKAKVPSCRVLHEVDIDGEQVTR